MTEVAQFEEAGYEDRCVVANFDIEEGSLKLLCTLRVYGVRREVRGECAGSLEWKFCGNVRGTQAGRVVRSFVVLICIS